MDSRIIRIKNGFDRVPAVLFAGCFSNVDMFQNSCEALGQATEKNELDSKGCSSYVSQRDFSRLVLDCIRSRREGFVHAC